MSVSCEDDSRLPIPKRLSRIMDPSYPLCREDIVWVLHYVQKSGPERSGLAGPFQATSAAKLQQLL